jgi:hypothetical protein
MPSPFARGGHPPQWGRWAPVELDEPVPNSLVSPGDHFKSPPHCIDGGYGKGRLRQCQAVDGRDNFR